MIVIEGTVRLKQGMTDAALAAMGDMIKASRAEAGCVDYSYAVDVLDNCLIRVPERWQDRSSHRAHFTTPHIEQWRAAWETLGIVDRDLRLYEAEPEET